MKSSYPITLVSGTTLVLFITWFLLITQISLLVNPPAYAQPVYTNPVVGLPTPVADPFILKWNGEYYMYATGDPIMIYHSTDLVDWTEVGPALHSSDHEDAWNQTNVWAPEVVYRNGKFYMNYTATRQSEDWTVEERFRRIGIAVSDSPEGPFEDLGEPVTPGWGIDSHVFLDPDSGEEYMFYSYLYEPEHPGAGLVVDSMNSVTEVAGNPSHVIRGTEPWEDKTANPNDGSLRYTNEAPTVLKRDGCYYMIYSGGSWDLPTYSLAYAVSDRIMQSGLDGPGWEKVMPPILESTSMVEGPGHNNVTKAPNNVDDITAYHGRVVPFRGAGDRETFIDRLYWVHDRIHLRQPTLGALRAPDQPVFRDIFHREDGALGDEWEVQSGTWQVVDNQAKGNGFVQPVTPSYNHYVFEANIRFPENPSDAGGVTAFYQNDENQINVWLDPETRVLRTTGTLQGEPVQDKITQLGEEFRFDVHHQLLITKNAGKLRITLDGVHQQEHRLELGSGKVGLITERGDVEFDGIALTPHYLDHFNDPKVTWTQHSGSWMIEEGALHQVERGDEIYYATKGDATQNYEFTANIRTRDNRSRSSTTGIVAALDQQNRKVLAGFDHDNWPFSRFNIRYMVNGEVKESVEVELPRGFLRDEFHSIMVVKQGRDFTFYLDETEMAALRLPLGTAKPGLYTRGVQAAFDGVTMKHTVVPDNLILNGSFLARTWEENDSSPDMPWQLSGAAEINPCCGHTGNQRLLLTGDDGIASQRVDNLDSGAYRLYTWIKSERAEGRIEVDVQQGDKEVRSINKNSWEKMELDFDVNKDGGVLHVNVSGNFTDNDEGFIAFDDFYLYKKAVN